MNTSHLNKANNPNEFIPTRQSLLTRLKNVEDEEGWKAFFDTYWKLIYRTAVRAGLTDAEAQDVVQDTVLGVLRRMPAFQYDSEKGSFKAWLMRLTSWRIADQLRKRQRDIAHRNPGTVGTDTVERVPDPVRKLEANWDQEWEMNLVSAAIERVKRKVDAKQYQLFDLYVIKKWPVARVARALNVNAGRVYLAKHRIGHLIKKEITQLQTKPIYQ